MPTPTFNWQEVSAICGAITLATGFLRLVIRDEMRKLRQEYVGREEYGVRDGAIERRLTQLELHGSAR